MKLKVSVPAPVLALLVLVWISAVGLGLKGVWAYSTTPGEAGPHPQRWPAASKLLRAADRPTLVMFVHPKCPCSVASVAELRDILQTPGVSFLPYVVFLKPSETEHSWTSTGLWTAASNLPGVRVTTDLDGVEAERFGAATSGQTVVYDAAGTLTFAGGLTLTRGHDGDSPGRRAVLAVVRGGAPDRSDTPVYGCPLADPKEPGR